MSRVKLGGASFVVGETFVPTVDTDAAVAELPSLRFGPVFISDCHGIALG